MQYKNKFKKVHQKVNIGNPMFYGLFFFVFIFSTLQLNAATPFGATNKNILYQISPRLSARRLDVKMSFIAGNTFETTLSIVNEYGGEPNLASSLTGVKCNAGQVTVETDRNYKRIVIRHRPGQAIIIRYSLINITPAELNIDDIYKSQIRADYFMVYGYSLLALPTDYWRTSPNAAITVSWLMPSKMWLSDSFKTGAGKQTVILRDSSSARKSIWAGGAVKSKKFQFKDSKIYFTYRDFSHLNVDTVFRSLKKAVTYGRDFWGDYSDKYFSTMLFPTSERKGVSYTGTAFTNSFSAYISDNSNTKSEYLTYLFFHEFFHTWLGQKIRIKREEAQYWFSEGFTEYFQAKLQLEAGYKKTSQFIGFVNSTLAEYETSPVKNEPNSNITFNNFWENERFHRLPYLRGSLFALYIDLSLKKSGDRSLHYALRKLLAETNNTLKDGVEDKDILAVIKAATGRDFYQEYADLILNGRNFNWSDKLLPDYMYFAKSDNNVTQLYCKSKFDEKFKEYILLDKFGD